MKSLLVVSLMVGVATPSLPTGNAWLGAASESDGAPAPVFAAPGHGIHPSTSSPSATASAGPRSSSSSGTRESRMSASYICDLQSTINSARAHKSK